jgi:hypothetical protein
VGGRRLENTKLHEIGRRMNAMCRRRLRESMASFAEELVWADRRGQKTEFFDFDQ